MNTLSKLYLGSEPIEVTVDEDQLLVTLADGHLVPIPLQVIGQLGRDQAIPTEVQLLILRHPPQIDHVHVTDSVLNVYLKDGRLLSSPLAWFPRLLHGTPAERNHYELSGDDDIIHWPELDEDVELIRLFEGGPSVESERSLQRWLSSRQMQAEVKAVADEREG